MRTVALGINIFPPLYVEPSDTNWQSTDAASNPETMRNFIYYHLFRAIELPQTPIPATPMIHLSFPFAHYSFSHFTITQFFKTVSKLKCCCFILCCYRTASCSLPCLALYMPLLFQALLAFWAHSFSLVTGSLLYDNYFLHFWSIGWISFPLSLVAHFLANF